MHSPSTSPQNVGYMHCGATVVVVVVVVGGPAVVDVVWPAVVLVLVVVGHEHSSVVVVVVVPGMVVVVVVVVLFGWQLFSSIDQVRVAADHSQRQVPTAGLAMTGSDVVVVVVVTGDWPDPLSADSNTTAQAIAPALAVSSRYRIIAPEAAVPKYTLSAASPDPTVFLAMMAAYLSFVELT